MHIGYKSCNEYITTLEILGNNNEYREGIVDRHYAKFKTDSCKVLSIVHKETEEEISEIINKCDNILYKIGETIIVHDYNSDINKVNEIQYFLSKKAAYYYNYNNGKTVYSWYSNGQLYYESIYEKNCHSYKEWHINGKMSCHYNYENDKRHGIFKKWDNDGVLLSETEYINDTINKKYKNH